MISCKKNAFPAWLAPSLRFAERKPNRENHSIVSGAWAKPECNEKPAIEKKQPARTNRGENSSERKVS